MHDAVTENKHNKSFSLFQIRITLLRSHQYKTLLHKTRNSYA